MITWLKSSGNIAMGSSLMLAVGFTLVTWIATHSPWLTPIVSLVAIAWALTTERYRRAERRLMLRADERSKKIAASIAREAKRVQPNSTDQRASSTTRNEAKGVVEHAEATIDREKVASIAANSQQRCANAATPPNMNSKSPTSPSAKVVNEVRHEPPLEPTARAREWAVRRAIVAPSRTVASNRSFYRSPVRETHEVRVAAICDEFTFNSLQPDCDIVAIVPAAWRAQFEEHQPEVFFCESAWAGTPSSERPWRGQIYASINFSYENRKVLIEILAYCKSKGIPTVFWNKEDPTHFADRINDFVSTAAKFDYIFTTAVECIPEYESLLKRNHVGLMAFAAQPQIFYPDPTTVRSGGAVFAGAWYGVHRERSRVMEEGFDAILDAGIDLTIYDRDSANKDIQRRYPLRYAPYIRPAVPHSRTAKLYRQYRYGLNFNTVVTSETMCARRMFELAACGAAIISNPTPAVEHYFGSSVLSFDSIKDYSPVELESFAEESSAANLARTLRDHTYATRLASVFRAIGLAATPTADRVTRVVKVGSHAEAEAALRSFEGGRGGYSGLLLVVGAEVASHEVGDYYTRYGRLGNRVVSQALIRDGYVDPASLITSATALLVDGRDAARRDLGIAKSLAAHSQYCVEPIRIGSRSGVEWGGTSSPWNCLVTAELLSELLTSPDAARVVLEVPADVY